MTPAPELSRRKRARGEETGGDSGRAEDVRLSPRLKLVAGNAGPEDSAHPEVSASAAPHPAAAPEDDSAHAAGTTPVGVDMPPLPAADGTTAGDDAASHAAGAAEEASVRARSSELLMPAAQTPPSLGPVSIARDAVPTAGMRTDVAAGSLLLGLVTAD
jgi:hypothetical protein